MSSSSSDEEDERLKEALDPTLVAQDLYSNKPKDSKQNNEEKKLKESVKPAKKSLRPDKQTEDDDTRKVMSELKVTPGFQTYVARHLDIMISESIKETKIKQSKEVNGKDHHPGSPEKLANGGIRLLKRSAQPVDMTEKPPIILKRPNLLKHRSIPDVADLSEEELSSITVTTEQVLAKQGTEYYANKFASRVEEGEILAKKKKKMGKSERERNKRKKEEEENKSKAVTNGIEDSSKDISAKDNNES